MYTIPFRDPGEKNAYRTGSGLSWKRYLFGHSAIDLKGEKSSFKSDIGYIGEHTHVIDMNEVVNHLGRCTESELMYRASLRMERRRFSVND